MMSTIAIVFWVNTNMCATETGENDFYNEVSSLFIGVDLVGGWVLEMVYKC